MRFMGGEGFACLPNNTAHPEEPLSLPKWRLEGLRTGPSRRAFVLRQAQEPQSLLRICGLGWISSLSFILLWLNVATPAQAYPGQPSDYTYCRVELPVAGQVLTATRTLWPDGRFAFQTSSDPPDRALIWKGDAHGQRAYLTWRQQSGGGKGAAKLWVVIDNWIFDRTDDARIYARPVKGEAGTERELAQIILKDGFFLFEFDPQSLLTLFPDEDHAQLVVHAPGNKAKFGGAGVPLGRINLALLRAQVAALGEVNAALDREQALPGACKAVQPSGFEEADVANWNWCRFDLPAEPGGGPGLWSDGHRLMSGLRLGKHAYLDLSHSVSDGKDGHAFLSKGFEGAKIFPYQLRYVASVYAKAQRLTLTSGTETLTLDLAKGQDQVSLNWADLMRLDRTGAEIKYRQAYDNGTVLSEGSLPAGSFRALEVQMQVAYRQVLEMRKDPITHCSPPPPIIVT
jgi:hypothetical protein